MKSILRNSTDLSTSFHDYGSGHKFHIIYSFKYIFNYQNVTMISSNNQVELSLNFDACYTSLILTYFLD